MKTLHNFIQEPYNPICNFNLASEYEGLNQTAAAASFYLRTAEKTNIPILQYLALLRNAICFEKQGNRDLTVKTLLQRAISILPNRPEGYYLLSRLFERKQEYHDCYVISCIGLKTYNDPDLVPIVGLTDYFDKYKLLFQKSVAAWWVGLTEESREITFDLFYNYILDDIHKSAVQNNLNNSGLPKHKLIYSNSLLTSIKHLFNGVDKIKYNYAQTFQDLFVLTVLNGKRNGSYLELGCNDPFYNNNTALLETVFDWKGLSIDIELSLVNEFNSKRNNKAICENALNIDYKELLEYNKFDKIIDYLQIDCDPPNISLNVLKKVLESGFKFRVITFEHDYYYDKSIRQLSRDLLTSYGYNLLVNDVSFNKTNSFEDWWVLEKVDNLFLNLNSEVNFATNLFLKDNFTIINNSNTLEIKSIDIY